MSDKLKLMLGDWVGTTIGYQKVYEIYANGIRIGEHIPVIPFDLIQPIVLTADVMESIGGMEKRSDGKYSTYTNTVSMIFTPPLTLGEWQTFFIFEYDEYRFVQLPFLHQLQQLIRLPDGKEIKVKWEK